MRVLKSISRGKEVLTWELVLFLLSFILSTLPFIVVGIEMMRDRRRGIPKKACLFLRVLDPRYNLIVSNVRSSD
jgi:hypothetical protein